MSVRAVSMRIGTALPPERIRRHTLRPSTPGIIQSSTMRSGSLRHDRLEGVTAVGHRLDLMALQLEGQGERLPDRPIVLRQQHPGSHPPIITSEGESKVRTTILAAAAACSVADQRGVGPAVRLSAVQEWRVFR